jgi:deoxyribose-phosphate aldolase
MALFIDKLTERDIAKTIDHSLLRPELDDAFVEAGCRLAAKYDVASVCVRPADVRRAAALLAGTDVAVGTTIGFPHGNHRTETKVFEAQQALADGATELDMVLQIGALKSGRDADVQADIEAVVRVGHAAGAIVKVIFENAYLTDDEKVRACRLTEAAGADIVKTSTGFAPSGATHDDLRLMRANTSPHVRVKAAGGFGRSTRSWPSWSSASPGSAPPRPSRSSRTSARARPGPRPPARRPASRAATDAYRPAGDARFGW